MNIIAPRTLRDFWERHPRAETPLREWLKRMRRSDYQTLGDVRAYFPTADLATTKAGNQVVIFDVSGNNSRLVIRINYTGKRVYARAVMTGTGYSRWNARGNRMTAPSIVAEA